MSVNPPGNFLWYPEPTEEQIGRFAELCAGDDDCRTRTDDLAATVRDTAADLPERWLFLPIKEGNVRVVSMFGLFDTTPQAGTSYAPRTFDVWLSAAEGDASGLWLTSLIGDLLVPDLFVYGQHAAAGLSDAEASRDYFAAYASGYETDLAYASTSFGFARGRLADAWPVPDEVEAYADVRPSEVETLLVSGELDVATPPQIAAEQLLPQLANGQQVILPGFGHQSTVFTEQPEASTRLITTFYDSGGVDDSLVAPIELDFDPGLTFGALAKVALAVLIALAALAALALALVARRVHTKGRIGTASSAALRSALPVVLGLGGWSLAALVALATMPAVHIDHALVVVLGSGLPIGLGIYWAWGRRDRSASTRQAGLALSLMGALVGAWLGFLATGGLLGVVTGIIGAILGANLALLLLDVSRPFTDSAPEGQVP